MLAIRDIGALPSFASRGIVIPRTPTMHSSSLYNITFAEDARGADKTSISNSNSEPRA
jgi:hypothetical protein